MAEFSTPEGESNLAVAASRQDQEHLNLLTIFHYVVGGLAGLFSLFPLIHVGVGLAFVFAPHKFGPNQLPPAFFGWFFVIIGTLFILLGLTFATFILLNGRFLARRKHYTFCLVVAGIECMFFPFGTALGVFTILVLSRPSVKKLFAAI